MSESIDIVVPDLGDFSDVEVIEVLVASGDKVAREDGLITLETDKATMDVPAPQDGVIESISVSAGSRVSAGDVIGRMSVTAGEKTPAAAPAKAASAPAAPRIAQGSAPPAAATAQPAVASPAAAPRSLPPIDEARFSKAHASPSVRKLARELGVDLAQVRGTGPKERILHDDLKAFVKSVMTGAAQLPGAALPKVPMVDFAKFGPIETKPLTRIQKISGPRLQASWINLPHVTQHDLADITALEAKRQALKGPAKARGISLTPLAFILKACLAALKEFPRVNASLSQDGESLVFKNYYHLGFAADTDNGLVVPVIRNADKLDVYELAGQLGELLDDLGDLSHVDRADVGTTGVAEVEERNLPLGLLGEVVWVALGVGEREGRLRRGVLHHHPLQLVRRDRRAASGQGEDRYQERNSEPHDPTLPVLDG